MSNKNRWRKKDGTCLSIAAKVRSLAIKCYLEQMPKGWDYVCSQIKATAPKDFHVVAIRHYKDTYAEDGHFWKPAFEKPHYHIIFRCVDRKKTIRVGQVMWQLGIKFRPDIDDELWKEHGVETVRNFSGYTTYLTHETEDAIEDGKERYDVCELVSNLTLDEIEEVRQGYLRVSENGRKVTTKELVEIDDIAFNLGYDLRNFEDWYNSLPFNIRSHAKMKTIRESYFRGVKKKINENTEILRLCVFIQGEKNTGKTHATIAALSGKQIYTVEGGGSGKFDNLRPDHNAMIISDDICPNLLNMSDNYICQAYRRQSNNPAWAGNYLIVTSNLTFFEWLQSCNVNEKHYNALKSRFFICIIKENENGTKYLAVQSVSNRGTTEQQIKRIEMFLDFKRRFDSTIAEYKPNEAPSFDEIIDPEFLPADRLVKSHLTYAFQVLGDFTEWFWTGTSSFSPWFRTKQKNASVEDKLNFICNLPWNEIQDAVTNYKDHEVLAHFSKDMIFNSLKEALRVYDDGDFDCEPYEV